MLSALLFLQFHSLKNRLTMRFKRLKQPKYLFGAIVGGLYFYFYFFRHFIRVPGRGQAFAPVGSPEALLLYEGLGALILLVIVALAWILPHERAALAFTEAEVAFLFPAPISRRGLIHFKLLRSQFRILVTTFFLTLVTNRFGGNAWIHAAGWWLILSTLSLHFLVSSFGRTRLLDRGITNWQRRLGILALMAVLAGSVLVWARRTVPGFDLGALNDFDSIKDYVRQVLAAGPAPYLLFPFRLIVRPYLAPDVHVFLQALAPALAIMVAHYWWVVRSNVSFEEASVEASKKMAEKVAAVRSGNWQTASKPRKAKRAPFRLAPTGPAFLALLWKNLIGAGQAFTLRTWVLLIVVGGSLCLGLRGSASSSGVPSLVGMLAAMLMAWSLIIGPQLLRQDFRQDLSRMDMLKMYPLRGWQIALGELLGSATILTGIQWLLLLIAVTLFPGSGPWGSTRLGVGFGAALIIPMLNLITLQIPNAAVLLFPAWFQASKEGAHGIEATGQRLIFMLGQLVVFVLALLAPAALFAGIFFLARLALGLPFALALASIGAAMVLAVEAGLGLMLLGLLFDRFDLSEELNP
jgi:ABC-2 type transport system permease protein